MLVWTVIAEDEDYDGYFAHTMYGPPDRSPAWAQAVKDLPAGQHPIAMIRGDFADNVVTENNKEDWNNE